MEALGINLGLLIVQIIAFFIVMLTLHAWIYKPFLSMLESRKQKIAQGLEDARVAAQARADAEKEAANILAGAHAEASKVVREATDRASSAARDIKVAAEAEVARIRETARAEAETERNRILGDLRGQVAGLAIAAAEKLVGETLDAKKQHALLEEFFSGVKSGRVPGLVEAGLRGSAAEVTSALPLTEEEQSLLRREIIASAGAGEVTFHVDPSVLGGLVIKVGDRVLDTSVAGRLGELRESLT